MTESFISQSRNIVGASSCLTIFAPSFDAFTLAEAARQCVSCRECRQSDSIGSQEGARPDVQRSGTALDEGREGFLNCRDQQVRARAGRNGLPAQPVDATLA